MKKGIAILLFLLFLQFQPSSAMIDWFPYQPVTVVLENCSVTEDVTLHLDLLVPDTTVSTDTVLEGYSLEFPQYETFTYLTDGTYVSVRAYINPYAEESSCELYVPIDSFEADDFYLVLFDDAGTVVYKELYLYTDTGYQAETGDYQFFMFNTTTNTMSIEVEERPSFDNSFWGPLFAGLLFIFGVIIFGTMLFIGYLGAYFIKRETTKEESRPFVKLNWLFRLLMSLWIVYNIVSPIGNGPGWIFNVVIFNAIFYAVMTLYNRKKELFFPVKNIVIVVIINLVYDLLLWISLIDIMF